MDAKDIEADLVKVHCTEEQIQQRLAELAQEVWDSVSYTHLTLPTKRIV